MDWFIAKKIAGHFVALPGILIAILLLGGLWGLYRGRLERSLSYLVVGGILWGLSLGPTADMAYRGLESGLHIPEAPSADVIIMMGGAIQEGSPDITGTGIPTDGSWNRLVTTARLQKRLNTPVILSGGRVYEDEDAMGPVYKRMLVDLGVPESQILLEGDSRDTIENALFSKAICEEKGFERPIVVTSAAHMKRTLLSFEKVGLAVRPFPCGFITWSGKTYRWPDYLPGNYAALSTALHEYLGLLFYRYAY